MNKNQTWSRPHAPASRTYELSEEHRKQWGIETGYREDKHGFPKTKTESRKIRRLTYAPSLAALDIRAALNDPELDVCLVEVPRRRPVTLARAKDVLLRAIEHELDALGVD